MYDILYEGLEYLQLLVSGGGWCPGPSPLRIQRDKCGDNPDTQNVSFARKTKNTTWPFVVNTVDPWPISLLTHLPFKLTPCLL